MSSELWMCTPSVMERLYPKEYWKNVMKLKTAWIIKNKENETLKVIREDILNGKIIEVGQTLSDEIVIIVRKGN